MEEKRPSQEARWSAILILGLAFFDALFLALCVVYGIAFSASQHGSQYAVAQVLAGAPREIVIVVTPTAMPPTHTPTPTMLPSPTATLAVPSFTLMVCGEPQTKVMNVAITANGGGETFTGELTSANPCWSPAALFGESAEVEVHVPSLRGLRCGEVGARTVTVGDWHSIANSEGLLVTHVVRYQEGVSEARLTFTCN